MSALLRHRSRRGMTLIELLMSFAILMAGVVCIFGLLLAGTSAHRRAIKETEATMIAGSLLADLRGEFSRGNLPKSDRSDFFDEIENHPGFTANRILFSVEPRKANKPRSMGEREYFVRVRVRWSEKGENQFVEFNTVMFLGTPADGVERAVKG